MSHGGPTSTASPILNLEKQFWTSRGFAGSTSTTGLDRLRRAYRQRLSGEVGVVDVQDCVNAARYLVEQGEADGDRLPIRGGARAVTSRSAH
jgi:dipeptidyl aminopeptidase/acylaminoacyl peptidase